MLQQALYFLGSTTCGPSRSSWEPLGQKVFWTDKTADHFQDRHTNRQWTFVLYQRFPNFPVSSPRDTFFILVTKEIEWFLPPPPPERGGFVTAIIPVKQGDQVASVTGGACCFRWVSRLRTYRDREGAAVGNVTNVVCIIGNRVIILWLRFGKQNQIKQYDSAFLILSPTCKSTVS